MRSAFLMRLWHRYLGFFLAGVMAMYAISGIVLIFRNTDFLKRETAYAKTLDARLDAEQLGREIGIKRLAYTSSEGDIQYFENGSYNAASGEVSYTKEELPFLLEKFTKVHKATTNSPLYWLNIGFGLSLLFFVISGLWMYMPSGPILRKGLIFTAAGIAVVILLLVV